MIFPQTKPQVKKININYHDLYYTVFKNENEEDNDQYENDFINFDDFVTPNHYIGIKLHETILKRRILTLHIIVSILK